MINWEDNLDNEKFLPTKDEKITYKEDFEEVFGALNTYEQLINHVNANLYWKSVFTDWKQKGILN